MARGRRSPELSGRVSMDRRPGKCAGCGRRYTPRVAEAVCRSCVRNIVRDPDPWLARLEELRR